MSFPDSAVHHGAMVPYHPVFDADMLNRHTPLSDMSTWLAPRGVGPQVPYHGPDVDLDTYNGRPDDTNPRPHKFFQGEGHRWGVGPALPWHHSEMDYILGRLD